MKAKLIAFNYKLIRKLLLENKISKLKFYKIIIDYFRYRFINFI